MTSARAGFRSSVLSFHRPRSMNPSGSGEKPVFKKDRYSYRLGIVALATLVVFSCFGPSHTEASSTRLTPRVKSEVPSPAPVARSQDKAGEPGTTSVNGRKGPEEPPNPEHRMIPLGRMDTGEPVEKPGEITRAPALPGSTLPNEVEPNNTAATANPLGGPTARIRSTINPAGDVDFYSFTAGAGDRVYA